jgi:Flp pilus assembly protein TadD
VSLAKRKFKQAVLDLTRAIEAGIHDGRIYHSRGIAFMNLGRNAAALMDFTVSIVVNPRWAEAYHNRSRIYRQLGDDRRADLDMEQLQQLTSEAVSKMTL